MKAKDLLEKAEQEVQDEKSKYVLNKVKQSIRNVLAAEKTSAKSNTAHFPAILPPFPMVLKTSKVLLRT